MVGWVATRLDQAWAHNATEPLTMPTYDGSGNTVHPDVLDFGTGGWNGYRYWMAVTPYPNTDSAYENPSILVSNDKTTWSVPPGCVNPVIPGGANFYNADNDLLWDGTTLHMTYKFSGGGVNSTNWATSPDGVTWTDHGAIVTVAANGALSQTVVQYGGQFVMFAVNVINTPHIIERRTANSMAGPWSAPTPTTWPVPPGESLWHIDAINDSGTLYMIMSTDATYSSYLAMSSDGGFTWTCSRFAMLVRTSGGFDNSQIYRSTIVRTATGFDMWYSARSTLAAWRTGFAQITY